jgi:hypothetical protein
MNASRGGYHGVLVGVEYCAPKAGAALNPYLRQNGIVTLCGSFPNSEIKHTEQQHELRNRLSIPWRKRLNKVPPTR